ncbi:MAG: polysaccharide biosynthesis protein [Bacteroidetes bacterium]|nr:MAG: polysaccharide biosynthesis protein [Bacteroidota bacterium]
MISRTFFKSSLIYTLVGALPYASGFLLIPWFTAYLTPAQFGINALFISLMYFIQILSSFGMDMSAGVLYFDYKDDKARLKRFLGTVFIGLMISGIIFFLLFALGGIRLFDLVFSGGNVLELIPFGLFTIVSGVFNGIFKTYSALLVNQQRPERFFWLNSSNFLITIGASLTILYLYPYTLYGPILGRMIPAIVTASLCLILVASEYGLNWDPAPVKKIINYTTPLMLYALLTWVVSYIDRFIILRFMADPTYVGIYDFGVKLVLGIELLLVGLVNAVNPRVYTLWKDQNLHGSTIEVNRYYNGLTAFVLLLIPVFVLLAPILIPLVIKKEIYYQAFGLLAILAAGYASRVWFYLFMAPLMFFKRTRVMPRIFAVSALFEIIAAIFMIRWFGLMGAVWVNFLVKPLQALLLYLESRKVFRYRFNPWKIIWLPVIFMAVVIVSEFFITDQTRILFHAGQLLVSIILVWFAYRRELVPFVQGMLKLVR